MSDIQKLRNDYIDAHARWFKDESKETWDKLVTLGKALTEALEKSEPQRTGWFTADRGETEVRVRRELRADGDVYDEAGRCTWERTNRDGTFPFGYYKNVVWESDSQSAWIDHNGDGCPVPEGTEVEIKYRDGRVWIGSSDAPNGEASLWRWPRKFGSKDNDIIAYRVLSMPRPEIGRQVKIKHRYEGGMPDIYEVTELGIGDHWSWADFDINTRKGYWRTWRYVGVDRSLRGPVVVDAPDGDYIKWAVEEGLKVGPKAAYMWCDWDYLDEKGYTVRKLTEEEMYG